MARIKTAARNRLTYATLNQLMMIACNGPDIVDFDFEAAASVFVGVKVRDKVCVPQLQTSTKRREAREFMSFDWSEAAALAASQKQLPLAQKSAAGASVRSRLVESDYCREFEL